jgi:hypothetical protein
LLQQHYKQQAEAQQIVLTANGMAIPQGSLVSVSGTNGQNGIFQVTGTQTGRLTVSKPNYANVPRAAKPSVAKAGVPWRSKGQKQKPAGDPLTEARNLLRRGKLRGKKQTLRILDHGPNWKQQGCGARFRVLRWKSGQPPEWTAVGWHLSAATYTNRRDAYIARKELEHVAEVMDS